MLQGSKTALSAQEEVVPASELRKAEQRIRELERLLGKATVHTEILKEAVTLARKKKLISDSPLQLPDGTQF